jgi:hypothetical protein
LQNEKLSESSSGVNIAEVYDFEDMQQNMSKFRIIFWKRSGKLRS